MCLYPTSNRIMTATKERVVYKVLRDDNSSPYMDKKYFKNKILKLPKKVKFKIDEGIVEAGFHAYRTKKDAEWLMNEYRGKIVKMYIPVGAKYVLGTDGEIVSDMINTGSLESVYVYQY